MKSISLLQTRPRSLELHCPFSVIGNPEKLKNLGIETVKDLNGVGENLHDHLMLRPIYKINGLKSLNKKINSYHNSAYIDNFFTYGNST